jgi:predicted ATPase with chaperone activity
MTQSTQSISEFLDDLWTGLDESAPAAKPATPAVSVELPNELLRQPQVVATQATQIIQPPRAAKVGSPTRPASGSSSKPAIKPFVPKIARTLKETGLSEDQIARLILKLLAARGAVTGRSIATHIRLPFTIVEGVLASLRREQLLALKGEAVVGDYTYVVSEKGITIARELSRDCTYFGAAPVTLDQYNDAIERQSMAQLNVGPTALQAAFADLLIEDAVLDMLGPAINSGRGLFLFGEPGNGKTSIAERVARSFGDTIWIPRAITVDGQIMRVFDPGIHKSVESSSDSQSTTVPGADERWVQIRRPTVIAGGELTMAELEVRRDPGSQILESPLQLKSNGGVLLIDDFGRQRMPIAELLNRWIVPLEKRFDLLNLPSGKKVRVPFDQLVIFSTNLQPRDLVDEAFLRRIPYKIHVPNPTTDQFRELFRIMCEEMRIEYCEDAVEYLIRTHYESSGRSPRACHPRDLLMQIRNYCAYTRHPMELTRDAMDFAVRCYFSVLS